MSKPELEPEHGTRRSVRGRLAGTVVIVLAGVLAGVAAKVADESGIGWLTDLGTYPALWLLALALIARAVPAASVCAVTAGAFFAAAVVSYYTWAVLVLGFPWGSAPMFWITIAALAVPPVSLAAWWAMRNSGPVAGLVLAAVAALAVVNGAALRAVQALTGHLPLELVRPVQVAVEIAVMILMVVVFPRDRRTRWWAIGAWMPLALLTPRLLDQVLGRTGLG